ncbi:MAG: hypothetical protein U9N46_09630 [Euryarchaeota archaeon]|nr:hypothetical protein [Euryarchaeota archaeon]
MHAEHFFNHTHCSDTTYGANTQDNNTIVKASGVFAIISAL